MHTAVPRCQRLWRLPSLPVSFSSRQLHLSILTRRVPSSARPRQSPVATVSFTTRSTPSTMESATVETVERIHSSPFKLVMYVTGGAANAPSWLLSVPGASRTVLECRVPYSSTALDEVLTSNGNGSPSAPPSPVQSAASGSTAEALAKAAYRQAATLSPFGTPIIGAAATCALATDRDRRGDHRAFVSIHTGTATRTYTLQLAKGARGRLEEDSLASKLILDAVAAAVGATDLTVEAKFAAEGLLGPGDSLVATPAADPSSSDRAHLLQNMINGRYKTLEFSGSGGMAIVDAPRPGRIYLPGSFNPLHAGHQDLLAAACQVAGVAPSDGAFELAISNADKGLLPLPEIERRVAQFIAAQLPVVVTQAPLFTQKADLFPKSKFVVGYDTAARLVQEKYYGSETAMLLQFAKLAHQGCGFLVAGRKEGGAGGGNGPARFRSLSELEIPEILQRGSLFKEIPESGFRMDISSTELRERGQGLG